ncbi:alpha/beta fold hydrolase [Pseudomonas aeruginosa]|uniref:alpha/beta fold hydrolase n=1 Tax=Pseudomonas aeruginosa TaxID=287 RepID=UPI000F5BEAC7|nr:alpha/beta hydrolase [Pseudomonas aeruginosa]RQJ10733.1 alpha/beta hydrolase [Pseudomonas aeruginosa]HEJ3621335.1 alpha/beta hydrolase [Pseudomonas aeruginosa]
MITINVAGAKVAYRVDGRGPGLVLVHGAGGDAESNWAPVVDKFAKYWTVVRPDYSGSGQTIDAGQNLSLEILAEQVVGAAKAAGAVPFDLVGFSLGGSLATYIAAEYPDIVRSLVILAGLPAVIDGRTQLQFSLWRSLQPEAMVRLIMLTGFSPEFIYQLTPQQVEENLAGMLSSMNWDGFSRQVELASSIDVIGLARMIKNPTLVVGFTHDNMIPPVLVKRLASSIPNSRYEEVDAGHMGVLEKPNEIFEIVKNFLRKRTKDGD